MRFCQMGVGWFGVMYQARSVQRRRYPCAHAESN